jgi:hypothetical protein
MSNAYPELPRLAYARTTVPMADVTLYLRTLPVAAEIRRACYVLFRIESGNGHSGINNNYVGAQADGGRWPAALDASLAGTVVKAENQTGRERIFLAFTSWTGSVDFLVDRVGARGLYVGGATHQVVSMAVEDAHGLARAYQKEWVTGSAAAEPDAAQLGEFLSIYAQAASLFPHPATV